MSWTKTFWSACSYVTDVSLSVTSYTLDSVGSLACFLGGVGLTSSQALDETIDASYLGAAKTVGMVQFDIQVRQFQYRIHETQPFARYDQMDGGSRFQVTDYLNPQIVQLYSGMCILSGTALKVMSANLNLFRQGLQDRKRFKNSHGSPLDMPYGTEFVMVTTGSMARSLALTAYGIGLAGIVIECSGLVGSSKNMTYPGDGPIMSGKNYTGPVTSTLMPMEFSMAKNVTFKWPFPERIIRLPSPFNYNFTIPAVEYNVLIELAGSAKGALNATYGGGAFFKSNSPHYTTHIASSLTTGVLASLLELSMFKLAQKQRDYRIYEAGIMSDIDDIEVVVESPVPVINQ